MVLVIGQGPWQLTVYILFGTLVAVTVITMMGPIANLRDKTGGPPPEGHPFHPYYTTDSVRAYLAKAGADGVKLYRRALVQDIAFFMLYGAGFVFLIDGTLGRLFRDPSSHGRIALDAIGAAAAVADALEDLFLSFAVPVSGDIRSTTTASVFTFLKWSLVTASGLAVATGTILVGLHGTRWL